MSNEQKQNSRKKLLNNYMRYASMGIQMGVIMFIGTYGGYRLDKYCNNHIPVFTLLFALLSVAASLYLTLKDFIRKKP
ncbi:MAG: putative F0F1-ATPase [Bacteroidetes bacterium ADurb.Bin141]|nr:AtpZ/AtpI family protein [Bacteroidia bacterium]MBX3106551.1 AtpZ/AtpI family protein [Bacteroidota bacterium]MCE7955600.1 AtpZ/AtpI family protein [Bacteroidetes bacterium CHB6]OQB62041.1 MAG: putative F0F1-ATPase [Bacteroidetes bacterium ADurb.Bin141]MCB0849826.1 AtpZ/AtpI family protein [Bacteroidota bacterium]